MERQSIPVEMLTKRNAPTDGLVHSGQRQGGVMYGSGQRAQDWRNEHPPSTIGWCPTCACYDTLYCSDFPQARNARKRWQRAKSGDWWRRVRKRPGKDHWDIEPAVVLDCFMGAGTTALVAIEHGRDYLGIDLQPEYIDMTCRRLSQVQLALL